MGIWHLRRLWKRATSNSLTGTASMPIVGIDVNGNGFIRALSNGNYSTSAKDPFAFIGDGSLMSAGTLP